MCLSQHSFLNLVVCYSIVSFGVVPFVRYKALLLVLRIQAILIIKCSLTAF